MITAEDETKSREKKKRSFFDESNPDLQQMDPAMAAKIAASGGQYQNIQEQQPVTPVQPAINPGEMDPAMAAKIAASAGNYPFEQQTVQTPANQNTQNPVLFPESTKKTKSAQEYLDELFSIPQPKPIIDSKRPEDLARIQKANAIAKGLNIISDIVGLQKNAKINRRQADGIEARANEELFKYLDDYANKMDQFNYREYNNKQQNAIMALNNAEREKQREDQNKRLDSETARWNAKFKQDAEQWQKSFDFNVNKDKADQEYQNKMLEWRKQEPYIDHNLKMQEKQADLIADIAKFEAKARYDKMTDGYNIYTKEGKPVASLDKGEVKALVQIILKDPVTQKKATDDFLFMKGQLGEGMTEQMQLSILAYYWDESPLALKFLEKEAAKPTSSFGYLPGIEPQQRPAYVVPGTGNQNTQTQTQTVTTPAATEEEDFDINQFKRK